MKLEQALKILTPMVGQTIEINENVANKGRFGHALERFLELNLGSHHLDFEDGELKTCAVRDGKMKEPLKICKVWDKEYIESKLANMLLVVYDFDTRKIQIVKQVKLLEHELVRKQFDLELDWLLAQPNVNLVSESATEVFIAKTNDRGNKLVNERACYIAAAPLGYMLGLGYPPRARKGKDFVKEMETYEQTKTRCAA